MCVYDIYLICALMKQDNIMTFNDDIVIISLLCCVTQ